jgi:murein DD-endopeptidase MepM/ murein hydrolase activator NlpD
MFECYSGGMEELARYLAELRTQIMGSRTSASDTDPITQSILGFLSFLGELFGIEDNGSAIDGTEDTAPYQNDDDDDHGHDDQTPASGDSLFNGIRASAEASGVWADFQRRTHSAPVTHISPVDDANSVVTSERGARGGRTHHGLDIDTTTEGVRPNIVASADGVVLLARNFPQRANGSNNYGNTVIIGHSDGTYTVYAHLRSIDTDIRPGMMVSQNDIIGVMGNSGGRMRTHLHYEQREGSGSRDPLIQGRTFDGQQRLPDLAAQGVEYTANDAQITLEAFIAAMRGASSPVQRH